MRISDEEYEAIIKEMSERIKDFVFMNAERKVRQTLTKERVEELLSDDDLKDISIYYGIIFKVGDLLQIIGRFRRKKKNSEEVET